MEKTSLTTKNLFILLNKWFEFKNLFISQLFLVDINEKSKRKLSCIRERFISIITYVSKRSSRHRWDPLKNWTSTISQIKEMWSNGLTLLNCVYTVRISRVVWIDAVMCRCIETDNLWWCICYERMSDDAENINYTQTKLSKMIHWHHTHTLHLKQTRHFS